MPPRPRSTRLPPSKHHVVTARPSLSPYAAGRTCPLCYQTLTLPAVSYGDDLVHQHCALGARVDRLEHIIETMSQMLPFTIKIRKP